MASLSQRTGLLGRRLAAHLLRRATFGPTLQEIDSFAAMTADQAVDQLLQFPPLPDHPKDPATQATWVVDGANGNNTPNDELFGIINSWWLHQIFDPAHPTSLFSKMCFFLHTSFSTDHRVIVWSENHYYTLRLQMINAKGSYKDFSRRMCLDNGMNDFQDIGDSQKGNPNENFARELLELFTIGKGPQIGPEDYTNYTETDVREAARLLTGFRRNDDWNNPLLWDPDTGLPRAKPTPSVHDETDKTFSHAFGNAVIVGRNTEQGMLDEINDLIEMIFAQPATAANICRRFYRMFVYHQISAEVEQDIIQPLATRLMANNYELEPMIRELLKSEHFYDADDTDSTNETIGGLIKSPLEFQAGMIRFFNLPIPDPDMDLFHAYVTFYSFGIQDALKDACFHLFAPPEVAGYAPVYQAPAYNRLWVSSSSLPYRYRMVGEHLAGPMHLRFDLMTFFQDPAIIPDYNGPDPLGNPGPHPGIRVPEHVVTILLDNLYPETVDPVRFSYFLNDLFLDNLPAAHWTQEWDGFISTGDDSIVLPILEKLVRGIIQAPEYQLG